MGCMGKVPHGILCLNTWSLIRGAVWGAWGRWSLAGWSISLDGHWGQPCPLPAPLFISCVCRDVISLLLTPDAMPSLPWKILAKVIFLPKIAPDYGVLSEKQKVTTAHRPRVGSTVWDPEKQPLPQDSQQWRAALTNTADWMYSVLPSRAWASEATHRKVLRPWLPWFNGISPLSTHHKTLGNLCPNSDSISIILIN